MKKRTVVFGWTKTFQRRVASARKLPVKFAVEVIKQVKADHRVRVNALRGDV